MTATTEEFCEVPTQVRLCYRVEGPAGGRPLLLIAGLGQQMVSWPQEFVDGLCERGCQVIRFDNRDSGRSSRVHIKPPGVVAQLIRRFSDEQYTLADMADDTVGLLDHLGLDTVNVAGMSMGGMIAQTVAARYPDRVRSLTSIISNTGSLLQGYAAVSTLLFMARPPAKERAVAIDRTVELFRRVGSRGFEFAEDEVRAMAEESWDRGDGGNPAGVARQIGAIYKSGDRTKELRRVTAPTVVIHGDRDPMVHPSGGKATAKAIPGARLVTIKGMGHDLPRGAWPQMLDLMAENAR